ncbi:MAG: hypothetical protein ABIJ97_18285 [Bacteroidota bacterium]
MEKIRKDIMSFFIENPDFFLKTVASHYCFNINQLKKYKSVLNNCNISSNEAIRWDKEILKHFNDWINWDILSENHAVFKDVGLIEKFINKVRWENEANVYGLSLSYNDGVPWSAEFIDKYEKKIDFKGLSSNKSVPWSEDLIKKYRDRWDYESLLENDKLPWSVGFIKEYFDKNDLTDYSFISNYGVNSVYEIVEYFSENLNWFNVSENKDLPWFEKDLLNKWKNKINWFGIASNGFLLKNIGFFNKNMHIWMIDPNRSFGHLSANEGLPWSEKLIEKYSNLWNWEYLCMNKSIQWDMNLINKYSENLVLGGFSEKINLDGNEVGVVKYGLLLNEEAEWSIDIIKRFESEIDLNSLLQIRIFWSKAFKPYVDDNIVETVLRII